MEASNKDLKKLASDLTKAIIVPIELPFRSKYDFIESDVSNRLKNIDWFSQCGHPTSFDLTPEIKQVKTWSQAIKSSKKQTWENFQLEAQNQLTLFLFHNYREQYRKWNEITREHKKTIIEPLIEQKIRPFQIANNLEIELVHSVQWDILSALMENSYMNCSHKSIFFLELLMVYEAGHFPYGWEGK